MVPITVCGLCRTMGRATIIVTAILITRERGDDRHTMKSGPGITGLDTPPVTIMNETGVTTMVTMDTSKITMATTVIIIMPSITMTMILLTIITMATGSTPGNSSKTGISTMVS